jgi:hypothetical protein
VMAIVDRAAEAGARYVLAGFGMTLRDRQRDYYYAALDRHFPGLRERYESRYGDRYGCRNDNEPALASAVSERVAHHGLQTHVPPWEPAPATGQLALF